MRVIVPASTPHASAQCSTGCSPSLADELVEAVGVGAAPLLVDEPGVEHRAHHPEREGRVGSRQRGQVLVGDVRGPATERVDDDQLRAGAPRLEQLLPQVGRGRHRVPAPDEQVPRVRPLLRVDLGREALRRDDAGDPGARADRPHEVGGAERVHHPVRDRARLERAHRPHVAVGKERLRRRARRSPPRFRRRRRRPPPPSSRCGTRPAPFGPVRISGCRILSSA